MQHKTDKPILLLGAYGRGNAGDDVFIYAAAALFAGRTLYINSADDSLLPKDLRGTVRTISTVSAGDLFKKIKLFLSVRDVVYWGGDLWVKLYGTKAPRQLLYKMVIMNLLLRLFGKHIYYIGCGIGDLHGYSRWLARLSARMAKAIVVREQRSAKVLGLRSVSVLPDLAINLPYNRAVRHTLSARRPFSIVISVLWSIPDPERNFPRLIGHIAELINSLPAKDFKITLLPMHSAGEVHDDLWASEQQAGLIRGHTVEMFRARDLQSIVALLAESNVVIGTRLHTNILAVLNGTPAIGVSYRPKVRSFFADNGLEEYCVELDGLSELPRIFHKIHSNYTDVSRVFYDAGRHALGRRPDYESIVRDI